MGVYLEVGKLCVPYPATSLCKFLEWYEKRMPYSVYHHLHMGMTLSPEDCLVVYKELKRLRKTCPARFQSTLADHMILCVQSIEQNKPLRLVI